MSLLKNSFLILALSIIASCISQEATVKQETMEHKNKELIRAAFGQWKNGTGTFFDLLDENVVWTVAGRAPFSGNYHGKQEFIDKAVVPINDYLSTPIMPQLVSLTAEDDILWLNWKGTATSMTGKTYENHYAWRLKIENQKIVEATAFLDTYELYKLIDMNDTKTMEETEEYIGMWVTEDGYIRHELLPGNRYHEIRGKGDAEYRGGYQVTGNHIDYQDDTGFTADGEFKDGILYHAGMVLYKEK